MIDWPSLRGRSFRTIQGATFTVVNVTSGSVVVQPATSRRRYDISIAAELERILDAYRQGRFLPKPYDLVPAGVRHERASYAWGILHALLAEDQVLAGEPQSRRPPDRGRADELVKVDSSTAFALGYDPAERAMEVVFWNGEIWRYEDVSPEEYQRVLAAQPIDDRLREIVGTHRGCRLRYLPRD
ncbi:MAG: KTSC domain-containing protein [Chloroflexi bacterium]|nr:KTSC domain-containing protein [Chloroflexota bacterium]